MIYAYDGISDKIQIPNNLTYVKNYLREKKIYQGD